MGMALYGILSLLISTKQTICAFKVVGQVTQMQNRQSGWQLWIKKVFDRSAALFALIVLSPILACTSVLVRLSMGSPILFRQRRPGRYGMPFELVKFRSMSEKRTATGTLLPDASRLTRVGSFLRATSLDELPQLWNVLCGDLSLVGPRPLLMEYLPRYSAEQSHRHDVMPGITGWAQINGRNALNWDEKFFLDLWYVENWSLWLDMRIVVGTFKSVALSQGISSVDHVTMPSFMGSSDSSQEVVPK
jgi:lipopolysaccharide/colanic/teichoic acid biosynthesis glycosyltransferase